MYSCRLKHGVWSLFYFYSQIYFLVSQIHSDSAEKEYSHQICVIFQGLLTQTWSLEDLNLNLLPQWDSFFTSESPWVKETSVVIQIREKADCISWRSPSYRQPFCAITAPRNEYFQGIGPWNGTQLLCIVEGYPSLPPTQHSTLLCLQSDITF